MQLAFTRSLGLAHSADGCQLPAAEFHFHHPSTTHSAGTAGSLPGLGTHMHGSSVLQSRYKHTAVQ